MFELFAQTPVTIPQVDVGFLDPLFNAIGIGGNVKQVLMLVVGALLPYLYSKYVTKTPDAPKKQDANKATAAGGIDANVIEQVADAVVKKIPIPVVDFVQTPADQGADLSKAASDFGSGPIRNGIGHVRDMLNVVQGEFEKFVGLVRAINDPSAGGGDGGGNGGPVDISKFMMSIVGTLNVVITLYPYLRVALAIIGVKLPNVPLKPIVITPELASAMAPPRAAEPATTTVA